MNSCDFWAMLPEALGEVARVWRAAEGVTTPGSQAAARGRETQVGRVAVLPLVGPIMPRGGGLFEMLFGGTALERFDAALAQAMADPGITALVLDIDSPGGMVSGVPETAAKVRAARESKPIIAVSNSLMASAAYWIGSQANQVLVSPSSQTGSIGVYALHLDMSRAYDAEGITPTLISAGKYKTEGHQFGPLDDTARAFFQAQIEEFYGLFVDDVAAGRGRDAARVRNGFGEGRVLGAEAAVAAHLADRVGTLEDAVRLAGQTAQRKARAQAEGLRLRVL